MRGVGQALDPVEVGHVVVVGLGQIFAEVAIPLAPDDQGRRRDRAKCRFGTLGRRSHRRSARSPPAYRPGRGRAGSAGRSASRWRARRPRAGPGGQSSIAPPSATTRPSRAGPAKDAAGGPWPTPIGRSSRWRRRPTRSTRLAQPNSIRTLNGARSPLRHHPRRRSIRQSRSLEGPGVGESAMVEFASSLVLAQRA